MWTYFLVWLKDYFINFKKSESFNIKLFLIISLFINLIFLTYSVIKQKEINNFDNKIKIFNLEKHNLEIKINILEKQLLEKNEEIVKITNINNDNGKIIFDKCEEEKKIINKKNETVSKLNKTSFKKNNYEKENKNNIKEEKNEDIKLTIDNLDIRGKRYLILLNDFCSDEQSEICKDLI